jgi:hypothetical protein
VVKEQHRRQLELARQMVDDAERGLPVIVQKPAVGPQHAELQRVAAAVVVAATVADLGEISRCQAPVPGEFILARLDRDPPPFRRHLRGAVIGRH